MKRSIPQQMKKKMRKEIRLAQAAYPVRLSIARTDELSPEKMLTKYPKRVAQKQLAASQAAQKKIGIKKSKAKHHISKRTTPSEVKQDSAPANSHQEGVRWVKTLTKQNLAKRRITTRQMLKKK